MADKTGISVKRIYETSDEADGFRVLVDRLWPRGVKKADHRFDVWMKELAPSTELRRWYGHEEARWPEFNRRYREELQAPESQQLLDTLVERARSGPVTLLCAARDAAHSEAAVLQAVLLERLKADTSSQS